MNVQEHQGGGGPHPPPIKDSIHRTWEADVGGGAGLKEDSWAEGKPDGLVLVLVLFFK